LEELKWRANQFNILSKMLERNPIFNEGMHVYSGGSKAKKQAQTANWLNDT